MTYTGSALDDDEVWVEALIDGFEGQGTKIERKR